MLLYQRVVQQESIKVLWISLDFDETIILDALQQKESWWT